MTDPTPSAPVLLAERAPTPEDCDAHLRCWVTDYDPSLVYSAKWWQAELPRSDLGRTFANAYFWRNVTYWLPHYAIPTPEKREALPEREELAGLLTLAADDIERMEEVMDACTGPLVDLYPLKRATQLRAAAERLRGGGSDG